MNLSIFEVLGPVMIGPSSSHTAGAARLGRVAALIAARPFTQVCFGLHGSFWQTGVGHGTRLALLAGTMGIAEDDERLKDAEQLARQRGIGFRFEEVQLEDAHIRASDRWAKSRRELTNRHRHKGVLNLNVFCPNS